MQSFQQFFDLTSLPFAVVVLLKLGIGVVLGGAIGWEREVHGRPAGLRTHMLMVLGVVLISEVSRTFGGEPSRIAAQIVTGVGFLGAGTIMRLGPEVKGLTSAASIWATAAIGMAVSTGGPFLWVAVAATVLCLFTLGVVDNLERRVLPNRHPREVHVVLSARSILVSVLSALDRERIEVSGIHILSENGQVAVNLDVGGEVERVLETITCVDGVISAHRL